MLQLSQLPKATPEEQKSEIYAWAEMISAEDWEVLKKMAERNEYMKEAVGEMEKINAEKEKRYRYLLREKWEHDEATIRINERKQGKIEGKTDGKAESVLILLEEIGEISEELRGRILGERDEDILAGWLRLAARAESLEEFEHKIRT